MPSFSPGSSRRGTNAHLTRIFVPDCYTSMFNPFLTTIFPVILTSLDFNLGQHYQLHRCHPHPAQAPQTTSLAYDKQRLNSLHLKWSPFSPRSASIVRRRSSVNTFSAVQAIVKLALLCEGPAKDPLTLSVALASGSG